MSTCTQGKALPSLHRWCHMQVGEPHMFSQGVTALATWSSIGSHGSSLSESLCALHAEALVSHLHSPSSAACCLPLQDAVAAVYCAVRCCADLLCITTSLSWCAAGAEPPDSRESSSWVSVSRHEAWHLSHSDRARAVHQPILPCIAQEADWTWRGACRRTKQLGL